MLGRLMTILASAYLNEIDLLTYPILFFQVLKFEGYCVQSAFHDLKFLPFTLEYTYLDTFYRKGLFCSYFVDVVFMSM